MWGVHCPRSSRRRRGAHRDGWHACCISAAGPPTGRAFSAIKRGLIMRHVRILAAFGLLVAAAAANAQVSSTVTLTSDYDFRGFSQSATDPAIQASLDYAHESGWYVGAWASNV